MQKEELLLRKRLIELSRSAFYQGRVFYSDFLNLNELNILHTTPKQDMYTGFSVFGGYAASERQIAAFLPDAFCSEDNIEYPIQALTIAPLHLKFAEPLTHRDYLGAVLNIGIDRCKLGDILVEETKAVLFAHASLSSFIKEQVTRIRHTTVSVVPETLSSVRSQKSFEEIKGTVASLRLDSLLSLAFSASRSGLTAWIEGGKVFVNGKMITSNGYHINEEDIISVRGLGKFQYQGILSTTKKGRFYVLIYKYI